MDADKKSIHITVVFALPDEQIQIPLVCRQGTRIFEAIELSGIGERLAAYHDNDNHNHDLEYGVYGFRQPSDYQLADGDRLEIYRPLILSPTEARRLRAKSKSK